MIDFRHLMMRILKFVILFFIFLVITFRMLVLFSDVDGVNIVNGIKVIKNTHVIASIIISSGFVIALNSILSRSIKQDRVERNLQKKGKHGYIDDIENVFIDDIPEDFNDGWSNEVVDDMKKEKNKSRFKIINEAKFKFPSSIGSKNNLFQTVLMYHSGGFIRGNRILVKVKVSEDGLHYQHQFIPKEQIVSFELNRESETAIKPPTNNPTLSKALLFGPLSLFLPNSAESKIKPAGTELSIVYVQDRQTNTLILEGREARGVEKALREMKNS